MKTIATAVSSVLARADELRAEGLELGHLLNGAIGAHALVDLDHAFEQDLWLDDVAREDFRPGLISDA